MKAILDHVGVAVRNLDDALAFYRQALGLEVDDPEEVTSQHVRAQMIRTGSTRIELLEPTSDDSAIAKYLVRRGPGLHHITLRVESLDAALAHLRNHGIRLVDDRPRAGAEGARIAFIHPSAAHGVLVELKEVAARAANLDVVRFEIGDLRLSVLHDGLFRLDGGAMFGIVPRALWERHMPADERHRIQLAMRPLLVEGDWGRLIIDCGAGDKYGPKELDIYGFDRRRTLVHALEAIGLTHDDVPAVLPTHLHFDHFGGATAPGPTGVIPAFRRARYLIRHEEWYDATHTHERNRASYLADDFLPLHHAGVIDFFDTDHEVRPGVRVVRTGGHSGQHQIVFVESGGKTAVFTADLIPTTAHIQDAWIMGYDLFPMETLAVKRHLIREAIEREYVVVFEHDPMIAAGYIRERDSRRFVEPLRYTN